MAAVFLPIQQFIVPMPHCFKDCMYGSAQIVALKNAAIKTLLLHESSGYSMPLTLRRIVQQVSTATTLNDALSTAVHQVRKAIAVDTCSVYLKSKKRDRHDLAASDGFNAEDIEKAKSGRYGTLVKLAADRKEPVNLAYAVTRTQEVGKAEDNDYSAFLGVPLIYYRQVLGVLVVQARAECEFNADQVAFLVTLAARLAKLIYDAAALDDINRLLSGQAQDNAFIQGTQWAPGIAIGTVVLLDPLADLAHVPDRWVHDIAAEESAFRSAINAVQEDLRAGRERMTTALPSEALALFDFYMMLLESNSLIADTLQHIRTGNWAPGAWRATIAERTQAFERMEDPYLQARAEDIRNIGRHLLSHLKLQRDAPIQYPQHCILMGDTISISEIAVVPVDRLAGIVAHHGSALSHAGVLARALGVPAVVSRTALPVERLEGSEVIVDGNQGRIYIQPAAALVDAVRQDIRDEHSRSEQLKVIEDQPATTLDGVKLACYANIGLAGELTAAGRSSAEGVGLFRTEYPFLTRAAFPTEDQQYELYREMLACFAPRPVTMRTLDVGGDKILPYFPMDEENSFLGCRGIRFTLDHPEILLIQMRAMLRANVGLNNMQLLFPMISRISEIDEALGLLARAYRELLEEGHAVSKPKVGAMIEVPSAVYLSATLAKRLDFLAVGTNDLTQYLLAADRNNAQVATPYDSLHPAVLNAVRQTVDAAHRHGKPVSVCGEMAGEPTAALLLLGMGVDVLSMNLTRFVRVKWAIQNFTRHQARLLLAEAMTMDDGFAIYCLMNGALNEAGMQSVFKTEG